MVCYNIKINNQGRQETVCSSVEEALKTDPSSGFSDGVIEVGAGMGDAASAFFHLPEDVACYISGTDEYFGQRRNILEYFGSELNLTDRNPLAATADTLNQFVYGGADLMTGHLLSKVFNQGLGLEVKYFTPAPDTIREVAADFTMGVAGLLVGGIKARESTGVPKVESPGVVYAEVKTNTTTIPKILSTKGQMGGYTTLKIGSEVRVFGPDTTKILINRAATDLELAQGGVVVISDAKIDGKLSLKKTKTGWQSGQNVEIRAMSGGGKVADTYVWPEQLNTDDCVMAISVRDMVGSGKYQIQAGSKGSYTAPIELEVGLESPLCGQDVIKPNIDVARRTSKEIDSDIAKRRAEVAAAELVKKEAVRKEVIADKISDLQKKIDAVAGKQISRLFNTVENVGKISGYARWIAKERTSWGNETFTPLDTSIDITVYFDRNGKLFTLFDKNSPESFAREPELLDFLAKKGIECVDFHTADFRSPEWKWSGNPTERVRAEANTILTELNDKIGYDE